MKKGDNIYFSGFLANRQIPFIAIKREGIYIYRVECEVIEGDDEQTLARVTRVLGKKKAA